MNRLRTTCLVALALGGISLPARAQAQQIDTHTLLPDSTAARAIDLYNREGTTRFTGESRLPAGSTLSGDVVSLGGPLFIGGHVTGHVVVINGDVHLLPTAAVDGSVTAIGGAAQIDAGATVAGGVTSYREPLRYREENGVIAHVPLEPEGELSTGRDFGALRTDLLLAVSGAYNRTEGLPISFGPRATFGTRHPTRVQALLTYRTANGFTADPDDMGYQLGVTQYVTTGSRIALHASLYRDIRAIEDVGLRNREASLAAFVLHRDYRDHYEREGWLAGVRLAHAGSPYEAGIEFRNERNSSVAAADPFTLLYNDDPWRAQPLVAEGRLHALAATFAWDTRNDVADPADGWLIRGFIERGLDGSLETTAASALPASAQRLDRFTTGRADVRRYARLSPYARISMRLVAGGSVDGGPLPAQRQVTLGGEGTLPGYGMFAFDCGARTATVLRGTTEFYPFHGCDRMALMQVEYQASFPFARRISERLQLGNLLTHSVRWAAFFDAGRAWTEGESRNGRTRGSDDFSADAGIGLRLGTFGIYWAVPLSGGASGYNMFMRLGPRL